MGIHEVSTYQEFGWIYDDLWMFVPHMKLFHGGSKQEFVFACGPEPNPSDPENPREKSWCHHHPIGGKGTFLVVTLW